MILNYTLYISVPMYSFRITERCTSIGFMCRKTRSMDGVKQTELNADKTQLIWIGTRQQLAKLTN